MPQANMQHWCQVRFAWVGHRRKRILLLIEPGDRMGGVICSAQPQPCPLAVSDYLHTLVRLVVAGAEPPEYTQ
jgi:hypothetical protein